MPLEGAWLDPPMQTFLSSKDRVGIEMYEEQYSGVSYNASGWILLFGLPSSSRLTPQDRIHRLCGFSPAASRMKEGMPRGSMHPLP